MLRFRGYFRNQDRPNHITYLSHMRHIGIDRYGSSRYRYRYMFLADISADTDTDILGQRYRPPIPILIFSLSRYLADNRSKGRYKPIFWPISRPILSRYRYSRYLSSRYQYRYRYADTDIQFTDTDISVSVSAKYIGKPIYRSIPSVI
jgi:hypothetical protein